MKGKWIREECFFQKLHHQDPFTSKPPFSEASKSSLHETFKVIFKQGAELYVQSNDDRIYCGGIRKL